MGLQTEISVIICTVTLDHHHAFLSPAYPSHLDFRYTRFQRSIPRCLRPTHPFQSLLCFHTLTNTFSRSPFPLTLLQKQGGVTPRDDEQFEPKPANSNPVNNSSRRGHPVANGPRPTHGLPAQPNLCYILFLGLGRRRSSLSRGARIVSGSRSPAYFNPTGAGCTCLP